MVENFLTFTEGLLNHVYWFKQELNIKPEKEHIGTSINYTDISERKDDFLRELVNTVVSWVYNKEKSKQIIDERLSQTNNDYGNASSFLTTQAFSKFRPGYPQGQFGELLLFNFIQHFFKAAPLLRKQRITTSTGHERYGADAIHYKNENNKNILILGESKCYESKYKFKDAFQESLKSIINSFKSLNSKLNLYTYDDFIEPEFEDIAKRYKENSLKNVQFELICLIAYNENENLSGDSEAQIKQSIKRIIESRCKSLDKKCFTSLNSQLLKRINYIIFPIWDLKGLLDKFMNLVGNNGATR